ncbi:MAG: hypothetical protein P8I99_03320 [Acidimicrobiales bacterium]|nr:hypothetical protein [Acidimicrobiales bacterium]MDG1876428.1 hypothetical protein [Acidimicrobiales bacterium]
MPIPKTIICVDCGGKCSLISYEPDEGWEPGDIVAFRCRDCLDRWDVELSADDIDEEDGLPERSPL